MGNTSRDQTSDDIVRSAIQNYVKTDDFRKKIDTLYSKELRDIIERSEKKASLYGGIAAALMFVVFLAAVSIQYINIREKRADILEKYVDAISLIDTLNKTITKTEQDAKNRLQALRTKLDEFERDSSKIQGEIDNLKRQTTPEAANNDIKSTK